MSTVGLFSMLPATTFSWPNVWAWFTFTFLRSASLISIPRECCIIRTHFFPAFRLLAEPKHHHIRSIRNIGFTVDCPSSVGFARYLVWLASTEKRAHTHSRKRSGFQTASNSIRKLNKIVAIQLQQQQQQENEKFICNATQLTENWEWEEKSDYETLHRPSVCKTTFFFTLCNRYVCLVVSSNAVFFRLCLVHPTQYVNVCECVVFASILYFILLPSTFTGTQ